MGGRGIDLTGQRFGRLTVLEKSLERRGRSFTWVCQCDCGMITHPIRTSYLLSGKTRSCGCLRNDITKQRSVKHGLCSTRLYGVWSGMKRRCLNPNCEKYKSYGGRGIQVCDEWICNFQAFYTWAMASGYKEGLTIDRIDVNGNYCPENCRWETAKEQANNRRSSLLVEINGETRTIAEWSHITGIGYETIWRRYARGDRGDYLIREVKA